MALIYEHSEQLTPLSLNLSLENDDFCVRTPVVFKSLCEDHFSQQHRLLPTETGTEL